MDGDFSRIGEKLNTEKLNIEKINTEKLSTENLNTENLNNEKFLRRSISVGDAIIMAGYAGTYGTAVLLEREKERICKRFGSLIYRQLRNKYFQKTNTDNPVEIANALSEEEILYFHTVSDGGIYKSLRQLGKWLDKSSGRGLAVDNKAIPIMQETIEICECLDRNPYLEDGTGSLIMVCRNEDRVINIIKEKFPEIPVNVIGRITGSRESMVFFGEGEHRTL